MRSALIAVLFLATAIEAQSPARDLYDDAVSHYLSGELEVAASRYADFLARYPGDPNAARAQLAIGEIHLAQGQSERAVRDFDLVLKLYPKFEKLSEAHFLKGRALQLSGHRDLAIAEWMTLIQKYPDSEHAFYARREIAAVRSR